MNIANFWKKVDKKTEGECWEWLGSKMPRGYGKFSCGGASGWMLAHRACWEIHKGDIPEGIKVCHRCDNPGCVNPSHLFLGTQQDNMVDMHTKNRHVYDYDHPSKKLTYQQVQEIKELYAKGIYTQLELGLRFGVNRTLVSMIVNGKRRTKKPA